jgi:hypothetical protein
MRPVHRRQGFQDTEEELERSFRKNSMIKQGLEREWEGAMSVGKTRASLNAHVEAKNQRLDCKVPSRLDKMAIKRAHPLPPASLASFRTREIFFACPVFYVSAPKRPATVPTAKDWPDAPSPVPQLWIHCDSSRRTICLWGFPYNAAECSTTYTTASLRGWLTNLP